MEPLISMSNAYSRKKSYWSPKSKGFSTLENESESGLIHSLCSEIVLLLAFQICTYRTQHFQWAAINTFWLAYSASVRPIQNWNAERKDLKFNNSDPGRRGGKFLFLQSLYGHEVQTLLLKKKKNTKNHHKNPQNNQYSSLFWNLDKYL